MFKFSFGVSIRYMVRGRAIYILRLVLDLELWVSVNLVLGLLYSYNYC